MTEGRRSLIDDFSREADDAARLHVRGQPVRASRIRAAVATLAIAVSVAGCAGSGSSSDDPERVFRDFTAAMNAGNAEEAAALVADDAHFYGDDATDVGIDGLLASLQCAAEITGVERQGDDTADFDLEFTGPAPLDPPGADCSEATTETARVTVRDGKIYRITEVPQD